MKTIIRNFLFVLRRFKMATTLNLCGLATAFAAFIIILMQVHHETKFDTCHPTSQRIYRVDLNQPGSFSTILPRAFIEEVIASSPHIEAGTLINPYINPIYFTTEREGEKYGFKEAIQTCHADIVKIFDFPIIEGDPDCLKDPDKMVIPESLAHKLFGKQSAVGKQLHAEEHIWSKDRTDFTIGAVYKDFPANTQLVNLIYTAIDPDFARTDFSSSNYLCYILADSPNSVQNITDNFNQTFDFNNIGRPEQSIQLIPITDIYFLNEGQDGRIFKSGNRDVTYLLFLIAILIVVVAVINYVNFSTALTPMRIKSINTQKVLGSPDSQLRRSLLIESISMSMFSWILGLSIVKVIDTTLSLPFIAADLSFSTNPGIILLSGIVALSIGAIAGIYPAWYMVSFPPALVLKGSFGLSTSGKKLRTSLIGIQFIVSIMLIVGSIFIRMQSNYMRQYSLGFDKDQIAIVELSGDIYKQYHQTYADRLKQFSGIEDVAFANQKVASQDGYSTNGGSYKDRNFHYYMFMVSPNFLSTMGIPIIEGRDFTPTDKQSEEPVLVFNHKAYTDLEMETGNWKTYFDTRIIGFTEDVKFNSLRQGDSFIAFTMGEIFDYNLCFSYIRLSAGTDVQAAVNHIRKTLSEIDPSYPFDVEFYDTIFDTLYQKETNLQSLIGMFSLLAIILSLVGVFGLVVFDTQYKRKEIAIRKVHGSNIRQILQMLNKQYLYIVVTCFIIATPIAYTFIKKWLESFTYRTPIYWWIFLVTLLIVATITSGVVTFQSWRAASANPVNSLKSE